MPLGMSRRSLETHLTVSAASEHSQPAGHSDAPTESAAHSSPSTTAHGVEANMVNYQQNRINLTQQMPSFSGCASASIRVTLQDSGPACSSLSTHRSSLHACSTSLHYRNSCVNERQTLYFHEKRRFSVWGI